MPSSYLLPGARAFRTLAVAVVLSLGCLLAARPVVAVEAAAPAATVRTVVEHPSSRSPAYTATLDVPQLVWPRHPAVADKVNVAIVKWVETQVHDFATQVRSHATTAKNLPPSRPKSSSLRLSYRVTRLDGKVLSLHLTVQSYVRGQASASSRPDGLTFNLSAATSYSLASLFRPNTAYLSVLARASVAALKAFHPGGAQCYIGGPGPNANAEASAVWWLSGNSLVLAYPPGHYTAAHCGTPTVTIAARALGSLLAPGGPLTP